MLHSAAQAASPLAVEKLLQFDKSQLESVDKFGNSPYVDLARSLYACSLLITHAHSLSIGFILLPNVVIFIRSRCYYELVLASMPRLWYAARCASVCVCVHHHDDRVCLLLTHANGCNATGRKYTTTCRVRGTTHLDGTAADLARS